jgi:hypothetical protein
MKPLMCEGCHKAILEWVSHQRTQGTHSQNNQHENAKIPHDALGMEGYLCACLGVITYFRQWHVV